MATYAIGDIQGCFDQLTCLLNEAQFNPEQDTLWVAGDMVNRGPKSLETLRYIKSLGDKAKVVLGNHDLHLLATAFGVRKRSPKDTFTEILNAPDKDGLLNWLKQQPLLHYDEPHNCVLVHAGLPPQWKIKQALGYAQEVHVALNSPEIKTYLKSMYGDQPNCWNNHLKGWKRLRVITNYLTRMRICNAQGKLDLVHNQGLKNIPPGYKPWFSHKHRKTRNLNILFGHWAALEGNSEPDNVYALDTGCVWGGRLTMMRIEDRKIFSCSCKPVVSS